MKSFHGLLRATALVAGLAISSASMMGQTAAAPEIQTFTQEVTVPFSQIGASALPTIPAATAAAIQGGALEIRHSATYSPLTRRLFIRTFLVAPGSPRPTPVAAQTSMLETFEVDVLNVFHSTTPSSFVLVGRVAPGGTSPFGNLAGAILTYSVGYGSGTPVAFNNTSVNVAGRYSMYGGAGTGTLTFVGQTGGTGGNTGGGTGGDNKPPVADAGPALTTVQSEVLLDATKSTDPENGALTYRWRSVGKTAAILDPTQSRTRVQFGEGFGEYSFEVTVTDPQGATATSVVRVLYVGGF